jgi:hypothetical protein
MKTFAAILMLSFCGSGMAPAAIGAPHTHTKVKASKRKPYKVKRAKVHRTRH